MATITRYFVVDFGPRYSGLATVGYTLPGGSRTTSGVTELHAGTGAYGATISYDSALSGALQWDTGGVSPVYAFEEVFPLEGVSLSPSGLDSVVVETGINARQALSAIGAVLVGDKAGEDSGVITFAAAGGSTTRVSATIDEDGNRDVTLSL